MGTKTEHYQLNQWEASDNFLRTDFNADNAKIENALTALAAGQVRIVRGSYTGNGAASQFISLGNTPSAVMVLYNGWFGDHSTPYGGVAFPGAPARTVTLATGGFTVTGNGQTGSAGIYPAGNKSGNTYHYLAFYWQE